MATKKSKKKLAVEDGSSCNDALSADKIFKVKQILKRKYDSKTKVSKGDDKMGLTAPLLNTSRYSDLRVFSPSS